VLRGRREFESRPDHGLVGKGCIRPLNMLWHWVIRGLCGFVILLLWCVTPPPPAPAPMRARARATQFARLVPQ
jgi:hypothetical protein